MTFCGRCGTAIPRPARAASACPMEHPVLGALALMLVFEGLMPFFSPGSWRAVLQKVLQLTDGQVRFLGLGSMLLGLAMLLFA